MPNTIFSTICRYSRFMAAAAATVLSACGGGVSAPTSPIVDSATITILPANAVMYSGLPTTFILSGGTGFYIVTSSNQAVLQVSGGVTGRSVTLVPSPVGSDTEVTLTARDTGSAAPVTAVVTVKPGTVNNDVTIIPSSTQAAACGAAVCAGGDAEVRVTLSQGGVPLPARGVRFAVISGDFRIITSVPGVLPETAAASGTTISDEAGRAAMRIRVLPEAAAQTALLEITDMATGAFRRTSFTIAPVAGAPLSAQPDRITFVGPFNTQCASGISAEVIVVGGRPPYSISQPGAVAVNPSVLTANGGRFSVTATGQCTAGSSIAVVDSAGSAVSVAVTNALGTATETQPLIVTPREVVLSSCGSFASVVATGGSGTYYAASGNSGVKADPSGSTVTISRAGTTESPSPALTSPQRVFITDGKEQVEVAVNLTGSALGKCPP